MDTLWAACREHRDRAVISFRLGMEGQGSDHLVKFIDALSQNLTQVQPIYVQAMNRILQELFSAQGRKDFLLVADLLEYGGLIPELGPTRD